jgi:hypothetical protein
MLILTARSYRGLAQMARRAFPRRVSGQAAERWPILVSGADELRLGQLRPIILQC